MKSVKRRFEQISKSNPEWSSYICFAETVKGKNFSKRIIVKWFGKLVDKNDYGRENRKMLLKHLCFLSKNSRGELKINANRP